jgi:uncharacterized protein (DUF779 family)
MHSIVVYSAPSIMNIIIWWDHAQLLIVHTCIRNGMASLNGAMEMERLASMVRCRLDEAEWNENDTILLPPLYIET